MPQHRLRRRGAGGHRAPHRGKQRLRPAGLRGDRAIDLRVPHPNPWLVRHRLQRACRQVRAGVRGPGRRDGPAGRGRPHRRVQQEHLGCGDARQLRPGAADSDPVADGRAAARLAARPRPRRPKGHSRFGVRRWFVHSLPEGGDADAAVDLHPPRRREHRMPRQRGLRRDGPDPRYRGTFQRTAPTSEPERHAARRRDPRQVGVDRRRQQHARRTKDTGSRR